jgi:hypothetical protein
MKLEFWELKVTADLGNISPCGMFNQADQPTQFGYFSDMDTLYYSEVSSSWGRSG